MRKRLLVYTLLLPAILAGCAAAISRQGTDEDEIIRAGTTLEELVRRLGPPLRAGELSPPREALALWEGDHKVAILERSGLAVSTSVFHFKGRLGKNTRATQASFDSFMTLGLAEVYLIPKALWERATDERLELTVWFDREGRAVAYKWAEAAQ
jgi:hypothetical protein